MTRNRDENSLFSRGKGSQSLCVSDEQFLIFLVKLALSSKSDYGQGLYDVLRLFLWELYSISTIPNFVILSKQRIKIKKLILFYLAVLSMFTSQTVFTEEFVSLQ